MYQMTHLPFGLKSASSYFSRIMAKVLGGLEQNVLVYIDDILIYDKTFENHLNSIRKVLTRFREFNLKASPKKCVFAKREITFLGHKINKENYSPGDSNTTAVQNFPIPKNAKEVKRFVGMVGFFRKFIPNFATIAEPLTRLTRKDEKFLWGAEQQTAFAQLRDTLLKRPILGYPDYDRPFHIFTDASSVAQAGALMQEDKTSPKKFYAIAYCSRTLSESERRWPAIQIELGAIVYALRQFKPYICLSEVILHCDHKPLSYLMSKSKTHDNLARWMIELQSYNIKIVHVSGIQNSVADALSRAQEGNSHSTAPSEELKDIAEFPFSFYCSRGERSPLQQNSVLSGENNLIDFSEEQRKDPLFALIFEFIDKGVFPERTSENLKTRAGELCQQCLVKKDGCLYIKRSPQHNKHDLLLVPDSLKSMIFHAHHSSALSGGHLGFKKTLAKIMRKYYWPCIHSDISSWCKTCVTCQMRREPRPAFRENLVPVHSEAVFAKVGLDLCGPLHTTERRNKYILNIICWFTRYVVSVPLPDARGMTIAHALLVECVLKYGAMSELVSDQASYFTSNFYKEFCNLLHIQQRFATPYHSMGNGATERTFRTFQNMLSKFINTKQEDWDLFVPCVAFCYNTSVNEATGETPYFLMFGRDPTFVIDKILQPKERIEIPNFDETSEYKAQLVSGLQLAWNNAAEQARRYKASMKQRYDRDSRPSSIKIGDRVLMRNFSSKVGLSRKLCFPWLGQFRVVDIEFPNATIVSITSPRSPPRKVHLNQIKRFLEPTGPASTLPSIPEEESEPPSVNTGEENASTDGTIDEVAARSTPTQPPAPSVRQPPTHQYSLRPRRSTPQPLPNFNTGLPNPGPRQ